MSAMRGLFLVIFFGVAHLWAVIAWASDPGVSQDSLRAFTNKLAGISQYQARFSQVTRDAMGEVLQEQQGTLLAKRPNRFVWRTAAPYNQAIISNGETVWIMDDDLEQVTVQALDKDMANTPALLLGGSIEEIQNSFEVSSVGSGREIYLLKPKANEALFSSLQVSFEDNRLVSMILVDHLDQRMEIRFTDIEVSPVFSEGVFQPTIPPGYDVIEQ